MIGAIIGDIAGSRFEFNRTNSIDFELFTPQCDFTDDTICTVAIADAIMNRNNDFRGALLYWCNRYTHPMGGYGGRFLQWLQNPVPYDSMGNGAAMRVSPCAWLYDDYTDVMDAARKQSAVSHDHPEGIRGAQCVADAILCARKGGFLTTPKHIAESTLQRFNYETDCDIEQFRNVFYETMPETIPVAFWAFAGASDYESAIRRAIAIGGDADTLGAITGSIAEAYWGVPRALYDAAMDYLPDDMKTIVEQFYKRTNYASIH